MDRMLPLPRRRHVKKPATTTSPAAALTNPDGSGTAEAIVTVPGSTVVNRDPYGVSEFTPE
jgi:hypothetical protein